MKFLATILLTILFLTACAPSEEDLGPRASLGNANAPVLIQEFSDLQCPACASISPKVEKIVKENPTIARLEYYHFPLPQHEYAFRAAEASECANDQGKFWEYIQTAFKNQRQLTDDNLRTFAGNLGLDEDLFNECFNSRQKKAKVKSDLYQGRRLRVNSTPSLFVNGDLVRWSNPEQFENYIKSLAQ